MPTQTVIRSAETTSPLSKTHPDPPPDPTASPVDPRARAVAKHFLAPRLIASKPNNTYTILLAIIAALWFLRLSHIIVLEQTILSAKTLGHLLLVAIPMLTSISHLAFTHDHMFPLSPIADMIFLGLRLGLFLGMAWSAPSAFVTTNATLPTFIAFLTASRLIYLVTLIVLAIYNRTHAIRLCFGMFLQVVPAVLWIYSITRAYDQLYAVYTYGFIADCVGTILLMYIFNQFTSTPSLSNNRSDPWTVFTFTMIAVSILSVFGDISDGPRDFNIQYFLGSCMLTALLVSVLLIYKTILQGPSVKTPSTNSRGLLASASLHYPVCVNVLVINSVVKLIAAQMEAGVHLSARVPFNVSIPVGFTPLAMTQTSTEPNAYLSAVLSQLLEVQGVGTSKLVSGAWNPATILLCCCGLLAVISAFEIYVPVYLASRIQGKTYPRSFGGRWALFSACLGVSMTLTCLAPSTSKYYTWIVVICLTCVFSLISLLIRLT